MKKKIFLISILVEIALLVSILLILLYRKKVIEEALVDSFSISGLLLLLFSGLLVLQSKGAFNVISYVTKKFKGMFIKNDDTPSTYFEYKELITNDKKVRFLEIVIIGGIFFIAGIVMYFIFY